MPIRAIHRAAVLAMVAVLAFAGTAAADTVPADGDLLTVAIDRTVDLGKVAPGAEVTVEVGFTLACGSLSHVDAGQTVTLTPGGRNEPVGGVILSATNGSVGPAPAGWAPDDEGCDFPAPTLTGGTTSLITLRAPSLPGAGYSFTLMYDRSLSPEGNLDGDALRSATAVTIVLEVVANTPPTLTLPDGGIVEGDTTGGWTAVWAGLGASDVEDEPNPMPSCAPAAGTVLPLGTTTVACSVTDRGGLKTRGTFDVTVVDTTAPKLVDPSDQAVTTNDPAGATSHYDVPAATDVVDASPPVTCSPADGTAIPVGTTTVKCSATDDSGNGATQSFDVVVRYVPLHVAAATWGEPVGADGGTFVGNRGRTLPVRVTFAVDGAQQTTGVASLRITPCGGGIGTTVPLAYGGGRWHVGLDTGALDGACHTVMAVIDGLDAGSFRLELRGTETTSARPRRS